MRNSDFLHFEMFSPLFQAYSTDYMTIKRSLNQSAAFSAVSRNHMVQLVQVLKKKQKKKHKPMHKLPHQLKQSNS